VSSRRRLRLQAIVYAARHLASWRVPLALAAAAVCLSAGVTWPIMRASRFVMFTQPFSILDGVQALVDDGDWAIATVIVVFSIVFPVLKIGVLAAVWVQLRRGTPPQPRLIAAAQSFGKWSMLDVFVVALVIFALKSRSFTDATTAGAIYPFIGAILLTAYSSRAVVREARTA
jgi:paraquat-inducible protein A